MKSKKLIPNWRFPEFENDGEWKEQSLKVLSEIVRGGSPRPIDKFTTTDIDGLNWLKIGDINKNSKYVISTKEKIKPSGLSKTREVHNGDLILSNSMSFGRPYILKIKACIHDGWIAIRDIDEGIDTDYLYYFILSNHSQKYFLNNAAGAAVLNLNADIIKSLPVFFPNIKEQKKIAKSLNSIDSLISFENKKLKKLKDHKKALIQNLFPSNDKNEPNWRFPEFKNDGDWKEKALNKLLDYERPDKYTVKNTSYQDSGIPVLTANKSFILGYTKESTGIYKNPTVIIFDDFTTDKKYVDFEFKVKSSAIKILKVKSDNNLKFIFETMSLINFDAEQHKRYYISEYQNLLIKVPKDKKEQHKIADCLNSIDNLVSNQIKKIEILEEHKKALLQNLFPNKEEI